MTWTCRHEHRRHSVAWVPAVLLVGLALGARAEMGEEISTAEAQVSSLEGKLDGVLNDLGRYQQGTSGSNRFEAKLTDAQAMMLLQDYGRAAVVFFDLVEDPTNRSHPGFSDALFGLAEALFANRNYIDANKYYLQLLDRNPQGRHLSFSLTRLMEISFRVDEFAKVDAYYERISKSFSPVPDAAVYLWAKTLVVRQRWQEAGQAFSSIAAGSGLYFQARYYLGVVYVQQSRLEEALGVYQSLSQIKARTKQETDILELVNLARGRLLFDLKREMEALDAYQSIEHTSENFDSALYEICWIYIQRADSAKEPKEVERYYLEALRTAEILEVSTPDSALVPKAKLLKGHIREKLGDYEQANEIFHQMSSTYSSVEQELETLLKQHEDPVRYFNEVAGKDLDSFDLRTYLPPMAVKWMSQHDGMSTALSVVKELELGRRFVQDARAVLEKLYLLLDDRQDRINLFPHMREGVKKVIEIENTRIQLEQKLSWLEERIIGEKLSEEQQKKYNTSRKERVKLERQVTELPSSLQAIDSREMQIRKRIEGLEKAVHESGIAVKGMKAQLRAMDDWIRMNQKSDQSGSKAVIEFRKEIRQGWEVAENLEDELQRISVVLSTEKSRSGLDSMTLAAENQLREQYMDALRKERFLAEKLYAYLDSEGTGWIRRINQLRVRVSSVKDRLQAITHQLQARVDTKAKDLKVMADSEKKRLEAFEKVLDRLEKESENLAGSVAYQTLDELRKQFEHLVLESDVGVLDVVWNKKQEKTREITDMSRKQSLDQKRLYKEYESVLEEAP